MLLGLELQIKKAIPFIVFSFDAALNTLGYPKFNNFKIGYNY